MVKKNKKTQLWQVFYADSRKLFRSSFNKTIQIAAVHNRKLLVFQNKRLDHASVGYIGLYRRVVTYFFLYRCVALRTITPSLMERAYR